MSTDEPTPPVAGEFDPNGHMEDLLIDHDLRSSYLSYAMSVIISRALPDVRDGLKPSHRRILLAMNDLNLSSRGKETKCAGIVGETMKRYHPHGDNSIYPTLVRMAQEFNTRYVLVSKQGNFGTIDGLPPAAMRYTEAKLSPIAEDLLDDLDKDTVDHIANYDETRQEALVLPSRFPNLLCNGSQGIAVGMATSIPPHNLGEVCDAVMLLLDKPDAGLAELIQCIPGPDFPTGGLICGRQGIVEGYKSGRSTITVRAKAHIEEGKNSRKSIVVTEIPYMQQKMRLVSKIADAVKEDKVKGVSNVQDHSDRKEIRIVIDVKRDADAEVVLNQLYQFTPLQDTFSIIMLALVNGRPQTLPLKGMLTEFINHRIIVLRRRTQYLLRKARDRAHLLEGLLIALSTIDEVIQRIRSSKDVPEARVRLLGLEVSAALLNRALGDEGFESFQKIMGAQAAYNLTRVQADHILQMQLQRLTALEQDKILKEYAQIRDEITEYERILSDEANLRAMIRQDMVDMKKQYADARRTEIAAAAGDFALEDLIADEPNVVTISHAGYIKRLTLDTYKTQGRGGKGVTGGQTKEGDFQADVFVASTHDYIMFFTNRGQCHWVKVYDIPQLSRTSQGRSIVNLLELKEGEKVSSYVPVRTFDERGLMMVTRNGTVKKTALAAYSRPKKGGIIGINLIEGDDLIAALLVNPGKKTKPEEQAELKEPGDPGKEVESTEPAMSGDHVILCTKFGMAIRFDEAQARAVGRASQGVKGIDLEEGDFVVGATVVRPGGSLLTVCERGYGKRTAFDEYRSQNRGGKGLIDIKTSDRNGQVVAVAAVDEDDEVMLISTGGMVVRTAVTGISTIGRNTQGVRLINLDETDRVAAIAKIASDDIADANQQPEPLPPATS